MDLTILYTMNTEMNNKNVKILSSFCFLHDSHIRKARNKITSITTTKELIKPSCHIRPNYQRGFEYPAMCWVSKLVWGLLELHLYTLAKKFIRELCFMKYFKLISKSTWFQSTIFQFLKILSKMILFWGPFIFMNIFFLS